MTTTDRIAGVYGSTAFKEACRVATTANITLSGLQTLDGVTLVDGDRVVVAFQTDTVENGVYNASAGVWTRTKDFDGSGDVTRGTRVSVVDGTLYANNIFVLTSANTVVIGSSAITFVLDATISASDKTAAAISAAEAVVSATAAASSGEAIGFKWEFDNTITMADPTSTKFRMNNADPTAVTAIAIADNTADTGNPDVSTFVLAWDDSASTNRGTLILREIANPENFAIFNITGSSSDNTGWTELAVTYVTGSSTFTDTGDIMITFSRTGDVGDASAVLPSIVATDTGKIMVVNVAGDSFELNSSGTSGQILESQGADALPVWVTKAVTFLSSVFRIKDVSDATKQLALNLTALDTATTRTMTMPNADVDLTNVRQATTSLTGFAELATDTEAFIGTDANRVLTPSNFGVNSLATNGYQKLAGGLILQWGFYNTTVAGTSTATFPVAFPTACLNVTGESVFTGALSNSSTIIAGSLNTTTFQFYQGATAVDFYWFAIGY